MIRVRPLAVISALRPWTRPLRPRHHSSHRVDRCAPNQSTYAKAVQCLNQLQSNFAVIDAIRKSSKSMNEQAIEEMLGWLGRIGYKQDDLNRIPIIHIAGTKGKGSTATYTSEILHDVLASNLSTRSSDRAPKVGVYTSPHLRFVRERIRINGKPLAEPLFAQYFFEVWDRIESSARKSGQDPSTKPVYFRFLTLVALHVFLSEGVDAAVVECGIGGEYDSTNIIANPVVTGITKLGIDHQGVLGHTLAEIAWHKAGIMKPLVPCFTHSQDPECLTVLRLRCREKRATLRVVTSPKSVLSRATNHLELKPMQENAELACAIALSFLKQRGLVKPSAMKPSKSLGDRIQNTISRTRWEGRFDVRDGPNGVKWFLDCAHTEASLRLAADWFRQSTASTSRSTRRVLIFNQQNRDHEQLLEQLFLLQMAQAGSLRLQAFDLVIFCTNQARSDQINPEQLASNNDQIAVAALSRQLAMAQWWSERQQTAGGACVHADIRALRTVLEAMRLATAVGATAPGGKVDVLLTGSVHLVGSFLSIFDSGSADSWEGSEKYYQQRTLNDASTKQVQPVADSDTARNSNVGCS